MRAVVFKAPTGGKWRTCCDTGNPFEDTTTWNTSRTAIGKKSDLVERLTFGKIHGVLHRCPRCSDDQLQLVYPSAVLPPLGTQMGREQISTAEMICSVLVPAWTPGKLLQQNQKQNHRKPLPVQSIPCLRPNQVLHPIRLISVAWLPMLLRLSSSEARRSGR